MPDCYNAMRCNIVSQAVSMQCTQQAVPSSLKRLTGNIYGKSGDSVGICCDLAIRHL